MRDNHTYGHEKSIAQALKASVGVGDSEYREGLVRGNGGGSSGAVLYRFTLNANWSSGSADADILEMTGADTGIDADVKDPLGIFADLGNGDAGLCLLQGGSYYVIQAPCPT